MTIHNKKTKKINVYAKNFRDTIDEKDMRELTKLTDFLAENEWLKVSKEKYYDFSIDKNFFHKKSVVNGMMSHKPGYVSWFSKGSWIFRGGVDIIDEELIYITVDYKNIFRINNKSPYSDLMTNDQYKSKLVNFNKKYIASKPRNKVIPKGGIHCDEYLTEEECKTNEFKILYGGFTNVKKNKISSCKWNNKTKKCKFLPCTKKMNDCYTIYGVPVHNWAKLLQKYDGFAIYPMMSLEEMVALQNHHGFSGWDVETLILSNSTPITHHHNLGTIRELLNISKKDSGKEINYSKLVSILINKISEIRKTM
jgi:hypothetical protein